MNDSWAELPDQTGIWDVIVVGAGPAGLAAATVLASEGASTLVLDEQAEPGGQIYRGVERASARPEAALLGKDYFHGLKLVEAFRASGAVYLPRSSVWHFRAPTTVYASRDGKSLALQGRAILLATGAMERPVPLPGWTLPGVMGAGGIQILLKSAMLRADTPMVLAGCGPLFYLLAQQCLEAGAKIVALLDTSRMPSILPAMLHLPMALRGKGPEYLGKGLRLMAGLRRSRLPLFGGASDISLLGGDRVEAVAFRSGGRTHHIEAGLVGLHEGVIPHQNVTRLLQCEHVWDKRQRAFRVKTDSWGQTSQLGIWIAGDGGGIVGARGAEHQGRLAALDILRLLQRIDSTSRDRRAAPERDALQRHVSVRPFLDALYPPSLGPAQIADDTMVCRCEEVRATDIRNLAGKGYSVNQIKAELRCGMGPCQGRMCGPTVTGIVAEGQSRPIEGGDYYNIRPPLKPIRLGELALMEQRKG